MKKILSSFLIIAFALFTLASTTLIVEAATNAFESPVALFETSLDSKISTSATSMTLVNGTTKDGSALASSTYSFIIDEGSTSEEFVIADCTSTACTNMQRGLSVITGTTTVTSLQKEHRRGASVKMTDGPFLVKLGRVINGIMTLPSILSYTTHPTFTATTQIVDKKYVDDTAFSGAGVIDATSAARGVVELATGAEAAASTAQGGSGVLVLPASIATSTYNSATAVNVVPVTDATGFIDGDFLPTDIPGTHTYATSTFSGLVSISGTATSTFATASTSSFTSGFTWAKPSNLKQLLVEITGGGAGGYGTNTGGGGGGGAYCKGYINAAQLGTTETVTIGSVATGIASSAFGSLIIAGNGATSTNATGGSGGDCSGSITSLFKIENFDGGNGVTDTDPATDIDNAGFGGGCVYGREGQGAVSLPSGGSGSQVGGNATGYGCGGGGAISATVGAGVPGILSLTEIFN